MKRLTLLRHAKSSWDDSGIDDHDRPLAARGLRDAPRMGRRLAAHGIAPDAIVSSSAVRARQTAGLVASALGLGEDDILIEPAIYLASPGELLGVLSRIDDAIDELVLVGHNPGLTLLANRLLPNLRLDNLPTAGAVAIDCDTAAWSGLDAAGFRLHACDYPKKGL